MRFRALATITAATMLLGLLVGSTAASAKAPASPRNPKVVVGLRGVWVTWSPLAASGVTYQVSSSPTGKSCEVVDADRCFVPVAESTPWRFQVTATTPAGTSRPSSLTRYYKQRTILVIAGQSNALGTGSLAVDPVTRVNYYRSPYANGADSASTITWSHLGLRPMPSDRPVKLSSPQWYTGPSGEVRIFGPELSLARKLYADHHLAVTVAKGAFGGSSLSASWNPEDPGSLFTQMVDHVTQLVLADIARGQLDVIGALYWYQGEADAADPVAASEYQGHLVDLIAAARSAIGRTVPVAIVKPSNAALLAQLEALGWCPALNCEAQAEGMVQVRAADDWVAANVAKVVVVDSADQPFVASDPAHLSNVGQTVVGQRLATASWPLLP